MHPRRVHLFFYLPKKRERPICMTILCPRKRMPQNRMTISCPRSRMPPFRTYHFRSRVGAYCIRPTNDPERGEYVQNRTAVSCTRARITQNRTNPAYIRKWMTQIHGIRFLSKTFVGRIQYAPTRGRKRYVRDCGVRDWGRKWYAQGGIYPIRFIIPPLRYEK